MPEYAVMSQPGFFDFEDRLSRLSCASDPLEGLLKSVDFEIFRKVPVVKALKYSECRRGGRPPHDPVMMFKIMILKAGHLSPFRAWLHAGLNCCASLVLHRISFPLYHTLYHPLSSR